MLIGQWRMSGTRSPSSELNESLIRVLIIFIFLIIHKQALIIVWQYTLWVCVRNVSLVGIWYGDCGLVTVMSHKLFKGILLQMEKQKNLKLLTLTLTLTRKWFYPMSCRALGAQLHRAPFVLHSSTWRFSETDTFTPRFEIFRYT